MVYPAPLIFRRRKLSPEELSSAPECLLEGVWRAIEDPSGFPPRDLAEITISRHTIEFPDWGNWAFIGVFGPRKLVLIDPDVDEFGLVRAVASFVSRYSWRSPNDHYLIDRKNLFPTSLFCEKLFYSDQPVGLHCGQLSRLLAGLLDIFGWTSTLVMLRGQNVFHIFLEIRKDDRAWLVDPDLGVIPQWRGLPLSFAQLLELRGEQRLDELHYDDIGERRRRNYLSSTKSVGQLSWKSGFMTEARTATRAKMKRVYTMGCEDFSCKPVEVADADADRQEQWRKRRSQVALVERISAPYASTES